MTDYHIEGTVLRLPLFTVLAITSIAPLSS